ncbi:conjugal transfer protein TraS, partial [Streptomyces xiamenensis]
MSELLTVLGVGGPLAVIGGTVAVAREKCPSVYWSAVGLPLSTVRLLGSYGSVMDACGLTVAPSRLRALAVRAATRREVRPVPPRRGFLRPTSTGLRLRLRLAAGQEVADVAASSERLRHAWGVHAVHVSEIRPGMVELRLVGFDVLR